MKAIQSMEKFQEVIQSEQPVIITFDVSHRAELKPKHGFIGDMLDEFNQFAWYTVSSDELTLLLEQYDVNGSAGILIFQSGEKLAYQTGSFTKTTEEVSELLHQQLG